jgi:N12 class adenine-specific DNA methylase
LYAALNNAGVNPRFIYDPSSGAGVFITEAVKAFPGIERITAVEKDLLTGRILNAISSTLDVPNTVYTSGVEETPVNDNGKYDLIVSNIPFGNFSVYDDSYRESYLSGRIHNYFFAKGLDKIAEGGLLAYITTDAFLNSPSNQKVREYLFGRADFVSLSVLPDNLMKDTGNTEAPSHLLMFQKHTSKNAMTPDEQLLVESVARENEMGSYQVNAYIDQHTEIICGEVSAGTNQYGKPIQNIWAEQLPAIQEKLSMNISKGLDEHFSLSAFQNAQLNIGLAVSGTQQQFSFLNVPEAREESGEMQLGLFDTQVAGNTNRALAYLSDLDKAHINKATARIISSITTTKNPGHESIVLIAAQTTSGNRFVYKLYSNVAEIRFSANWQSASVLNDELRTLSNNLKRFSYQYKYEGDKTLEPAFGLLDDRPQPFTQIKGYYKDGTLVTHYNTVGRISNIKPDLTEATYHPLSHSGSRIEFFKRYIALRDGYLELVSKESEGDTILNAARADLNNQYESFVSLNGLLNLPSNKRLIEDDSAFGLMLLSSLERREGEHFIKADILNHAIEASKEHFTTDDPIEALARSLNDNGRVDIGFIEAATGLSSTEVISGLAHQIYLNPVSRDWETADQYLSGNVVLKYERAMQIAQEHPYDKQVQISLEAIGKVQPEKIPFELLDFNLGERWIPLDYYNSFASKLFENDTKVNYFSSLDTFKVEVGSWNAKISQEFSITPKSGRTMYGGTILEHALENTAPYFTYEVNMGDKAIRVPDNEAIQLAHQKIENIRNSFLKWLQELSADQKNEIETLYNSTFNCYVLREYDGSHLRFPGLDLKALKIDDLHSSQRNGTWRIIQNRGALIDHEVGLGKTLIMILAAQEMKRLQILNKPMILALKANVGQIRDTYRTAYPNAKIVAPGDNDFTPDKRIRLLHEIKNNNWDCIIMTHDQFGKIEQAPEIQSEIFQKELDNVERDLHTIEALGGEVSRKMRKGLEIRKNNLENKLKDVRDRLEGKRDLGITFAELGVDHLFIDESHKFKNLTFTTRHERVAGLGNMEGSQKALNMLFAIRTLQQRFDADLCATFLSGTPISNSLTEMYLIFKFLRPKEMERQRIENFDGWAAVFARKTTDFEFSVTNEIIAKERFRHFIKVPELALFYNEITDYKTASHIKLDKPSLHELLVNIPLTPDQKVFAKNLMEFARTGDGEKIGRMPLSRTEDKARMLIATNYAKKMAVDMRLIDERYEDHPDNKTNVCARNVAEIYRQTNEYKGTQIIFSDIGTPNSNGFNVYDAIKEKLVTEFGIPAAGIAFIHDWQGAKKPKLFDKMNAGEIRVLLGSTEMAGTGLNVQKRVVAMHHLDIPWTPKDLEQRDGRGARQGNIIAKQYYDNKVKNFIYGKEQSLDNYKFNLLKNKQTFISQMKNCELNVRTLDEGAFDEKSGMNFSEYIAILSGDTSLLEKSKLEKKVAVMESLKKAHYRELTRSKYTLDNLKADQSTTEKVLGLLVRDEALYKGILHFDKDGVKENPIQLNGQKSNDPEQIGSFLIQVYQKWKEGENPKLGQLYGFDLYVRNHTETITNEGQEFTRKYNTFFAEHPDGGVKYTYNQGHPNIDNPKLTARHFLNAIDKVATLKEKYDKQLKEIEKDIPMLEAIVSKPFEKDNDLMEMKEKLAGLEREIAIRIQEKHMKERGLLEDVQSVSEEVPAMSIAMNGATLSNDSKTRIIQLQEVKPQVRRAKGMRF